MVKLVEEYQVAPIRPPLMPDSKARTSIVERPNEEMLPREPLGERKVELLSHAHRWNNQHCTLPLTRGREEMRYELVAIGSRNRFSW